MAKTRRSLTVKDLDEIYYKLTHGSTGADVARSLGLATGTVLGGMDNLRKYIGWVSDGSIKNKQFPRTTYLLAAKHAIEADRISIIKRAEPAPSKVILVDVPNSPQPPVAPQDHFTKLELAFALFTDSVQACIQAEVKRQVGEVMAENEALKAKLDEARLGNWTDSLRSKFN